MKRAVIITGASSGVGRALAMAFAAAGDQVVLVGRRAQALEELRSGLEGTQHLALSLDVTREADMQAMADACREAFGRIDILVASAGIGRSPGSERRLPWPTHDLPVDEWQAVVDVNLTGIFLSNRAVLASMVSQGSGLIINIGSSTTPAGLRGRAFAPAYCASKYAMTGFTESLALEVARHGVRVMVVQPGAIATPLVENTALGRDFGGAMGARSFAESIVGMADLPADHVLPDPHLLPFKPRGQHIE